MVLTYIYIFLENSIFANLFLGLSLYVSNTTNKDDGILYFHDTEYTADTIPSSLTLNKSLLGRYVTYYNTYIDLCEVQVHGKLAVIFFVPACNVLSILLKSCGSWQQKQISYEKVCCMLQQKFLTKNHNTDGLLCPILHVRCGLYN